MKPRLLLALSLWAGAAEAVESPLLCSTTAAPPTVRKEGISELAGDIVFRCTSTIPSGDIGVSLSVFFSIPITNRVGPLGATDAIMEVDVGPSTPVRSVAGRLISDNAIEFSVVTHTLTAAAEANVRIRNLRVNASMAPDRTIYALISAATSGKMAINQNLIGVAVVLPGLLANASSAQIVCVGSPAPDPLTFSGLLAAGTRFSTLRVTEGFLTAFEKKSGTADAGTRVVVNLVGFPSGSRVFVPTALAGSSAARPTSAGDLGLPASGGQYSTPTAGALVMGLVTGADASGAGGAPSISVPALPANVTFDGAAEIPLTGGTGTIVYEVLDSSGSALESTQIPIFLALPRSSGGVGTVASARLRLAPVSSQLTANATAPVPRFANIAPASDCNVLNDCNSTYFPRLFVDAPALDFRVQAGAAIIPGSQTKHIRVLNEGSGILAWTTTIRYQSGFNWLKTTPSAGLNDASITLEALPQGLPSGVYLASLTIDAGAQSGSRSFTVSLIVTAAPPPPPPTPAVGGLSLGPRTTLSAVVPGSRATVRGSRFNGSTHRVTFDGVAATVISTGPDQIDVVVPAALGVQRSAQVVVSVDGVASPPFTAELTATSPTIYPGAVFNQDFTPNSNVNAESVGRVFQIFATGLPDPAAGRITAKIHDREIETPLYAGPAPGVPGVQQVNFTIPGDLPAMSSEVLVCGWPANAPDTRVCSAPAVIWLRTP